ncbi:MAG: hypothetical protein ABW215_19605 [Kibdelosporangium sp.]
MQPPPPVDWPSVESWLGLTLPSDYKALADAYGPMDVGEFIWLHTPCVQEDRFDYGQWLRETHRSCRIIAGDDPPAFHPAPGGLLAWGTTRDASCLFWDTAASDDPDRWPVVIFDRQGFQTYEMSLLETLTAAVRTGIDLPGGSRLQLTTAAVSRTAFLPDAGPWTPPPPAPPVSEERKAALTEGSGLGTLQLLIEPPADPYLGEGTWSALGEKLGSGLPAEYVELMECYGPGEWNGWLGFSPPMYLADDAERILDGFRALRAEFPEFYPLALWPEPGGFLPFAGSIDGDQLGWLTEGEPDSWRLATIPRHEDPGPPFPSGLTDTLLEWVRGRFSAPGLAGLDKGDDPLEFATFQAWRP